MANGVQTYQEMLQEQPSIINDQRIAQLNQRLDPRLIKQRRSGGGMVKYIQGHSAMDQANRIFGYGNWGYRTVSVEQVVLEDPISHEAVGIEYKAVVEVVVRGGLPVSDVGSQPVSTWNVEDQIMQRRLKTANYNKTPVDEGPFTMIEKREARAVIVDAHEAAKKGAVTDALKRALRAFGNQFGNELYGDGHVDVSDAEPGNVTVNAAPPASVNAAPVRQQIAAPQGKIVDSQPGFQPEGTTEQALKRITEKCVGLFGDKGTSIAQQLRDHVVKKFNLGDVKNQDISNEALAEMWNQLRKMEQKQSLAKTA